MKSGAVDLSFTGCCFYTTFKQQQNTVVDQKRQIDYNSSIVNKKELK
jgi:hypothetical protein